MKKFQNADSGSEDVNLSQQSRQFKKPLCTTRSRGAKTHDKVTRTSPPWPAFVLEVPLCNLLTSMCDFVPCDRILQRAYLNCLQCLGLIDVLWANQHSEIFSYVILYMNRCSYFLKIKTEFLMNTFH